MIESSGASGAVCTCGFHGARVHLADLFNNAVDRCPKLCIQIDKRFICAADERLCRGYALKDGGAACERFAIGIL